MDTFRFALLVCVGAGLLFALGAYLSTRVSGVDAGTGNALRVAVRIGQKEYSLGTGSVIVALFVVSFACMTVVPIYVKWSEDKIDDSPFYLEVPNVPQVATVKIINDDDGPKNDLNLLLYKSGRNQIFTIENANPKYASLYLSAHYDWANRLVVARINDHTYTAPVIGNQASLPPVNWSTSNGQGEAALVGRAGEPTTAMAVTNALHEITDPAKGQP